MSIKTNTSIKMTDPALVEINWIILGKRGKNYNNTEKILIFKSSLRMLSSIDVPKWVKIQNVQWGGFSTKKWTFTWDFWPWSNIHKLTLRLIYYHFIRRKFTTFTQTSLNESCLQKKEIIHHCNFILYKKSLIRKKELR